jgi:hypothetical protein
MRFETRRPDTSSGTLRTLIESATWVLQETPLDLAPLAPLAPLASQEMPLEITRCIRRYLLKISLVNGFMIGLVFGRATHRAMWTITTLGIPTAMWTTAASKLPTASSQGTSVFMGHQVVAYLTHFGNHKVKFASLNSKGHHKSRAHQTNNETPVLFHGINLHIQKLKQEK